MDTLKCTIHKKYKGKRKPKNECVQCLNFYFALQKPRVLPQPTKVFKDKSKYTRKNKHKGKGEL